MKNVQVAEPAPKNVRKKSYLQNDAKKYLSQNNVYYTQINHRTVIFDNYTVNMAVFLMINAISFYVLWRKFFI